MYESVEQVRAVYLTKLREYKRWFAQRVGPARSWSAEAFAESERWQGCLKGIAEALGLTKEENEELRREAGLD